MRKNPRAGRLPKTIAPAESTLASALVAAFGQSFATKAKVKITGSCFVFCSQPMVCPFCRITVPANTEHRCERKSSK